MNRGCGLCVGIYLQVQILNLQMQIPLRTPAAQPTHPPAPATLLSLGCWAVRRGFLGVSAFEDLESAFADLSLHTICCLFIRVNRGCGLCVGIYLHLKILNLHLQIYLHLTPLYISLIREICIWRFTKQNLQKKESMHPLLLQIFAYKLHFL